MIAACRERRRETNDGCEETDCFGVGWCGYCMERAKNEMAMQHELIKAYLKKNGSITAMEAFSELGITKLTTRINEMIREGLQVEKVKERGKNRYGVSVSYVRYILKE